MQIFLKLFLFLFGCYEKFIILKTIHIQTAGTKWSEEKVF